jgi:hypothetical protein
MFQLRTVQAAIRSRDLPNMKQNVYQACDLGRTSFHDKQASFLSPLPKERVESAMVTTPGPSIPYNIKPRTVIPLVCPTANIWMCPLDVTSLTAHWLEDFPRGPSTHTSFSVFSR